MGIDEEPITHEDTVRGPPLRWNGAGESESNAAGADGPLWSPSGESSTSTVTGFDARLSILDAPPCPGRRDDEDSRGRRLASGLRAASATLGSGSVVPRPEESPNAAL
ncbi:MAG: hypothetical protein QOE44_3160 [Solirubrobacteraceae bacterium]|jgi:hypothetical protein|nr:hypothetical protein [Solirubrobacteraceae bacterium]